MRGAKELCGLVDISASAQEHPVIDVNRLACNRDAESLGESEARVESGGTWEVPAEENPTTVQIHVTSPVEFRSLPACRGLNLNPSFP